MGDGQREGIIQRSIRSALLKEIGSSVLTVFTVRGAGGRPKKSSTVSISPVESVDSNRLWNYGCRAAARTRPKNAVKIHRKTTTSSLHKREIGLLLNPQLAAPAPDGMLSAGFEGGHDG